MPIRLIGDMHGNWRQYVSYIKGQEETIQLGDLGFSESHKQQQKHGDPEKNKVLFGNHDDYRYIRQPYSLGHFGVHTTKDDEDMFFIRGAYSIDKHARTHHGDKKTWREEEELTIQQGNECVELFKEKKPKIVISHDCPEFLTSTYLEEGAEIVTTRTGQILQACWEAHKPDLWIHGHYHQRQFNLIEGCSFISLDAYMSGHKGNKKADYIDLYTKNRKYKFRGGRELYDY